jgi:hypothetical protein
VEHVRPNSAFDRANCGRIDSRKPDAGGVSTSPADAGRYEWIQGNLAGLGVRVKLDLVDVARYNDRTFRKDFTMQSAKGATITL